MHVNINKMALSLLRGAALAMALAAGGMASASTIHVAIDTSTFGASSGFIDMNLSVGAGVPLATAVVDHMAGFGSSAAIDSWGLTPVPGGYRFSNDTPNDLFHAVSFGGLLSFNLTFDGVADPSNTYVSHFFVSAYGDDMVTALGKFDPATGTLADFSWTPSLTDGGLGTIGQDLSDPGVSVLPEPAGTLLMGAGLAAMALVLWRRVNAKAWRKP